MTHPVISICHGWGCQRSYKCARSDYNAPPRTLQTWSRHYQAPTPGDNCPDFTPLPPHKRWSDGPADPRI